MSYTRTTSWSTTGSPQGSSVRLIKGGSLYGPSSDHDGLGVSKVMTSTVTSSGWQSGGSWNSGGSSADGLLSTNEKETMKNLNERLASYMDKVQELQEANKELEVKICDWHAQRATRGKRDYSTYEKTIADLQTQIVTGRMDNARLTLQMDNAKLAEDDFTTKHDREKAARMALEFDVERIRKLLDDMTIVKTDLEMEVEGLRKDLLSMKKEHEEEMSTLRAQQRSSNVSVELNAKPSHGLSKILKEVREEYDAIIEKYSREAEAHYKEQAMSFQQEVSTNTEYLENDNKEALELKRAYQDLQIELQAEISRKSGLERTLEETECNFAVDLQRKQQSIFQLEEELSNLRDQLAQQQNEHQTLLDIKNRLENEITTYRHLLEGDDMSGSAISQTNHRDANGSRKMKTIVKDFVDGRMVSSMVSEIHQKA
ncbi:keratin, type I cytoskeletal 19-like isoform X1 [Ambystoma mexicanum]|uniref:keratin, type I cytoskeletal 19-like isoform X1 n=2 Tax=Ambystoma mexicanum TaxID=8296 RepID=UPI0037E99ACA